MTNSISNKELKKEFKRNFGYMFLGGESGPDANDMDDILNWFSQALINARKSERQELIEEIKKNVNKYLFENHTHGDMIDPEEDITETYIQSVDFESWFIKFLKDLSHK